MKHSLSNCKDDDRHCLGFATVACRLAPPGARFLLSSWALMINLGEGLDNLSEIKGRQGGNRGSHTEYRVHTCSDNLTGSSKPHCSSSLHEARGLNLMTDQVDW